MFAVIMALPRCGDPAGPEAALGVAPANYTWTLDDVIVTGQPGG